MIEDVDSKDKVPIVEKFEYKPKRYEPPTLQEPYKYKSTYESK
jgi:hypothetical protein